MVLLFTLLFGVAVTAMTVLSFAFQRSFVTNETDKRGALLAKSLMMSAKDPLLERDLLSLSSAVEAVRREPDVTAAWVADHQGHTVLRSGATAPTVEGRSGEAAVAATESDAKIFSVPITYGPSAIGSAHVSVDMRSAARDLARTREQVIGTMLFGLLIGMVGTLWLARVFVKPVARLVEATHEAARGNLAIQVPVHRRDELGALAESFNTMVADLRIAADDIQRGYLDLTRALAAAIEAKDEYTRGHCQRVSAYAVEIGSRLALSDQAMRDLELAAILHDIGKIGIEESILRKAARLSYDEMQLMRGHPEIGERILHSVEPLRTVASYIVYHHEQFNGKGYPRGAKGDEIPLIARIIAVADTYDSMTSKRPYRDALPDDEAVRRLRAGSGGQFDPHITAVFLELHDTGVIGRLHASIHA